MTSAAITVPEALSRAVVAYNDGKFSEAERLCHAVAAANHDFFEAWYLLAVAQMRLGRRDDALASCERVLAIRPHHAEALNARGVLLKEAERFEEALASFDQTLAIKPDDVVALINRGGILSLLKRYDEALASYERAIALKPDCADALCNRGIILQELKRLEDALASYERVLAVRPGYAPALRNRGAVLWELKRFEDALASLDEALAIKPDDVVALTNQGGMLCSLKRYDEALASYEKAIALKPDYADALYNRGVILQELKRFEDALASYERALAVRPGYAAVLRNRGAVLGELKCFEDAVASFDQALAIKPDDAVALNNSGNVLKSLNWFDEGLASYERAIALKPDYADALYNRGVLLQELTRFEDALASYERALAVQPNHTAALGNRGAVLWALKCFEEALATFDKVLAAQPNDAATLNNRGAALQELKRFGAALASYDKALAVRPDYAEALFNRGHALHKLSRFEQAITDFERALAINPEIAHAKGLLLSARMNCCDWGSFALELEQLMDDVRAGKRASEPFLLLGLSGNSGDQLRCAETYGRHARQASPTPIWKGERYRHARMRVAYLSADFRDHPVCRLLAGLFEQHDHARFETIAVSFSPDRPSEMRSRVEGAFDRFIDVRAKSVRDVANLLRDLEIDIAVDLMGFTKDSRSSIFALRPAPVQVNYLGYPGTMGTDYMDYIIADRVVIPAGQRQYYREKVVWLPDTFQANDSMKRVGAHLVTRAEMGLPEMAFVFCAFSNTYKITPPVFDIWMRLLRGVEGSVLWLLAGRDAVERNLRREADARGVSPDRLVFAQRVDYAAYLSRYRLADLFLDTLPFNAGTTASDALWGGLPLVTCSGEAFASRMATSLLNAIGLPELAAPSLAQYEALAIELARNRALLSATRAKLVRNRTAYPLFNTGRFRRHIEAAYTTMWERYERGEPPASFAVERLE
jgi:protein O-GlcNAc transferase